MITSLTSRLACCWSRKASKEHFDQKVSSVTTTSTEATSPEHSANTGVAENTENEISFRLQVGNPLSREPVQFALLYGSGVQSYPNSDPSSFTGEDSDACASSQDSLNTVEFFRPVTPLSYCHIGQTCNCRNPHHSAADPSKAS